MNKIKRIIAWSFLFFTLFILVSCGSGEGDASRYSIDENNIEYVSAPSQDYIIAVLKSLDSIDKVEAASKGRDPNKLLGTEGGYYSAVYFSSPLVDENSGKSPVDKGNDGGGCVEAFESESDAIKREKHLGKFSVKLSGGHVRLGTIIVRTSGLLNDETRNKLEESICNALLSGWPEEKKEESATEEPAIEEPATEETAIETNEENADDDPFSSVFNKNSRIPVVFVESFVPSDKNSRHYKVEFRLDSFKNSKGKSFSFEDATVDVLYYDKNGEMKPWRVYVDGASLDQCLAILQYASPVLYNKATGSDVQEAINHVKEYIDLFGDVNGYYFANNKLGLVLSGKDHNYEMMLTL